MSLSCKPSLDFPLQFCQQSWLHVVQQSHVLRRSVPNWNEQEDNFPVCKLRIYPTGLVPPLTNKWVNKIRRQNSLWPKVIASQMSIESQRLLKKHRSAISFLTWKDTNTHTNMHSHKHTLTHTTTENSQLHKELRLLRLLFFIQVLQFRDYLGTRGESLLI